jgi:hypothetical protein
MNDQPRKTTVTLEDLLRLKRAEQPPAEFWAQFEDGLRAKQLAAIVEPRPWWAPFIRVGTRMARYQLPVGATAILAITFLTVREYHPASPAPVFEPAAAETASVSIPAPADDKASAADSVSAPVVSNAPVAVAANEPAQTAAASDARADQASPSTDAVGTSSHVVAVNPELTSAHYIAENLAKAQPTADPELNQMLGFSLRNADAGPARSEPLAQVSVPGESRHSRWLGTAWLASAGTGDSALRANEQATHHLPDRLLGESDVASRIDVNGNRLTVKF